jgi:hypothetical protein
MSFSNTPGRVPPGATRVATIRDGPVGGSAATPLPYRARISGSEDSATGQTEREGIEPRGVFELRMIHTCTLRTHACTR